MFECRLSYKRYLVIYGGYRRNFTAWSNRPLNQVALDALLETGFSPRFITDDHMVICNRSGEDFTVPITKWRYGDMLPDTPAPLKTSGSIVWLDGIPLGRKHKEV